jgi:hypothetical protein
MKGDDLPPCSVDMDVCKRLGNCLGCIPKSVHRGMMRCAWGADCLSKYMIQVITSEDAVLVTSSVVGGGAAFDH